MTAAKVSRETKRGKKKKNPEKLQGVLRKSVHLHEKTPKREKYLCVLLGVSVHVLFILVTYRIRREECRRSNLTGEDMRLGFLRRSYCSLLRPASHPAPLLHPFLARVSGLVRLLATQSPDLFVSPAEACGGKRTSGRPLVNLRDSDCQTPKRFQLRVIYFFYF